MLLHILFALLVVVVTRMLWWRWKYDLHKIPSPPGLPILGHAREFFYGQASTQFVQWTHQALSKLGFPKLMRIDLMGSPWLFVTDMNFLKNFMNSKTPFPKFVDSGAFFLPMIGNDPTAKSMFMSSSVDAYVKAVRRVYVTGFASSNLKAAMPKLDGVIKKACDILDAHHQEKAPVDIQELSVKLTLDAIGVVAFDTNLGGLDGSKGMYDLLLKVGYIARERFINPTKTTYCKLFPNSEQAQTQSRIINAMREEWDKLTKEILERDEPPVGEEPMWYGLRNLKDPETKEPVPYETLLAEMASIVIAGMDTTGHQLAFLFALLAAHPRVVEKLLDELKAHSLYGSNAKAIAFEDLGDLTYLGAIIKEAMRLAYIITSSSLRMVPEDMSILGYRVPKGTVILSPGTPAMNTEAEWGDPTVFRPERWLTNEDLSQNYYMAFSTGGRDCAGQKLAMIEMRLATIRLVTKYTFTLKGSLKEILKNTKDGLAMEAMDGIWLEVTPRSEPIYAADSA